MVLTPEALRAMIDRYTAARDWLWEHGSEHENDAAVMRLESVIRDLRTLLFMFVSSKVQ